MKVVSIRKKQFLDDYCAQRDDIIAEDVKFLAGAALTLLVPTVLYCTVSGLWLSLYLMACNVALGLGLGIVMFKKSSTGFLSCVPITFTRNVQKGARPIRRNAA